MEMTSFPVQASGVLGLGGRELRLGPYAAPGGVFVTRKVYIPADGSFARFVDVAENPDDFARSFNFDYLDNSGYGPLAPVRTSSGDANFTLADDWIVLPPDGAPGRRAPGRIFRTAAAPHVPQTANLGSTISPSIFSRTKYVTAVPARGRVTVTQWAIQGADADDAAAQAEALRLAPVSAFAHMDAIDRTTGWNIPPAPGIFRPVPGEHIVAAGDSVLVQVVFSGMAATHESEITGAVRLTTDDPAHPVVFLPLSLAITGGAVVGTDPVRPPAALALAGLVPNPARVSGSARVAYRLASSEPASITLYDVRGRVLARRVLERPVPGAGMIDLGRGGLAPGVLWLRLEQAGQVATTKGILLP
jgi:hypothetical protein